MIDFWGHFSGPGSYVVVCRAIAKELYKHFGDRLRIGNLRASYPDQLVDITHSSDEDVGYVHCCASYDVKNLTAIPGVGLLFGFPNWLKNIPRYTTTVGYHVCDLNRIPPHWTSAMNTWATHIVTPSSWCAETFDSCGVHWKDISVVHHGVCAELLAEQCVEPSTSQFVFDHYCSSQVPDRKGTLELIDAFVLCASKMPDAVLRIHTSSPAVLARVAQARTARIVVEQECFVSDVDQAARYQQAHVVVQPSRCEGFGMIPLEALSVGTPVITTACTGHAEWASSLGGGAFIISSGELGECQPGPGLAPSVKTDHIVQALQYAFNKYDTLRKEAIEFQEHVREVWSWSNVLQPLVSLLSELGA